MSGTPSQCIFIAPAACPRKKMIQWPSVMYVKPGTTNTAWTFLTVFLKAKQRSPGSVNHVPQCETRLVYCSTQVWPHVLITSPSSLSYVSFSGTCLSLYIYISYIYVSAPSHICTCLSLSLSLSLVLSLSLSLCLCLSLSLSLCLFFLSLSLSHSLSLSLSLSLSVSLSLFNA